MVIYSLSIVIVDLILLSRRTPKTASSTASAARHRCYVSCRQMSLAMSSVNLNRWQLQETTLMCRSIFSTSAVTGLTAVGDRQRGRYFTSQSAPTTMLKAGITV